MMMQLSVKTLAGKSFKVQADTGSTVAALKAKLHEQEGYPAADQRLVFAGKVLDDDHTLGKYNIQKGSIIHVIGNDQPDDAKKLEDIKKEAIALCAEQEQCDSIPSFLMAAKVQELEAELVTLRAQSSAPQVLQFDENQSASSALRALSICHQLHKKLCGHQLRKNEVADHGVLPCSNQTSEGTNAGPSPAEGVSEALHQQMCSELRFDKSLTPDQFTDIPDRGEVELTDIPDRFPFPQSLTCKCSSPYPKVIEFVDTVGNALSSLQKAVEGTDNRQAAIDVTTKLESLFFLAAKLELVSRWTEQSTDAMCLELTETQESIAENIAERKTALSVEDFERLDNKIAVEVTELRSDVQGQNEVVEALFADLTDVDASVSGNTPSFTGQDRDSVDAEIATCEGPRAASLAAYERQIETEKNQKSDKGAQHLQNLITDKKNLTTDQESIEFAIQELTKELEANSIKQSDVASKIEQTKLLLDQVDNDWENAKQSIAPSADKLAKREEDLKARKSLMSQMNELEESALEHARAIINNRGDFLKSARTTIILKQYDAVTAAFCYQYESAAKVNKGVAKREASLQHLAQQRDAACDEDDVAVMLQLNESIRELTQTHQGASTTVTERQAELEQTGNSIQNVIKRAITAAEQPDLLSSGIPFVSLEQPPLQFVLDGKVIVHPQNALIIRELEASTIRAEEEEGNEEVERIRKKEETLANKAKLKRAKELRALAN
jgi:hypothetical protein